MLFRSDFPGAVTGKLRPYKTWRPIEQATMSYGYGVSASLFQLARAYTVFARDGELIPVSMLKRQEPVAGLRVLSPQTAQQVREMLRRFVAALEDSRRRKPRLAALWQTLRPRQLGGFRLDGERLGVPSPSSAPSQPRPDFPKSGFQVWNPRLPSRKPDFQG